MALSFTSTRTICATPEDVFEALTNLDRLRSWMPNLVAIESLTEGPVRVGSQWKETRKMFGKEASELFEVTKFEPPERLGLFVDGSKGTTGHGAFHFTYDLTPSDQGTELVMNTTIDIGENWFIRQVGKLMSGTFKGACERDLDALKQHLEAPIGADPD